MGNKLNKSNVSIDKFLRGDSTDSLTIEIDGEEATFEYINLSWYEKQQCISKATVITPNEKGETSFIFDVSTYYTEALLKMITVAPFPITLQVLQNLKSEIGDKLMSIVPMPLDNSQREAVKKD